MRFHRSPVVTSLLASAALLLAAGLSPAQTTLPASPSQASTPVETAYKPDPGPHEVMVIDTTLTRDGKSLDIRIHAPRPADKPLTLPMIVFSHGAGGSRDAFPDLCRYWASHGYVVVSPTHGDSVAQRRARGETFGRSRDIGQQIVGSVNLLDRRADIVLILDSLDTLASEIIRSAGVAPAGKPADHAAKPDSATASNPATASDPSTAAGPSIAIDPGRIGMAGHSAGAMTTQMMAGVRFYPPRAGAASRGIARPEPRIRAFALISGQGLGRPAFKEDSWKDISAPMLVMAGSKDTSPVSDETPEGRRDPYLHASPGDKYLVYIDGATHGSYAGKSTSRVLREVAPDNIDYIQQITAFSTTAFFDAYLSGDEAAKTYLQSDALARHPGGKTEYKRK